MIVKKALPHASVPTGGIKDSAVREVVMKLNENNASLQSQLSELQDAVMELQRKKA